MLAARQRLLESPEVRSRGRGNEFSVSEASLYTKLERPPRTHHQKLNEGYSSKLLSFLISHRSLISQLGQECSKILTAAHHSNIQRVTRPQHWNFRFPFTRRVSDFPESHLSTCVCGRPTCLNERVRLVHTATRCTISRSHSWLERQRAASASSDMQHVTDEPRDHSWIVLEHSRSME